MATTMCFNDGSLFSSPYRLVYYNLPSTFNEAIEICIENNGDLARISSKLEDDIAKALLEVNNAKFELGIWIGVFDAFGFGNGTERFIFVDGHEPIQYFNVDEGTPPWLDVEHGKGDCVVITERDDQRGWLDISCENNAEILCRVPCLLDTDQPEEKPKPKFSARETGMLVAIVVLSVVMIIALILKTITAHHKHSKGIKY